MKASVVEFNHPIQLEDIKFFKWLPENIRNLPDDEEVLTDEELNSLKAAYELQYRKTNFARFLLNFIPALLTGFIFHLFYWIIKAIIVSDKNPNAEFNWDWSREFKGIDKKVKQLDLVNKFINNPPDSSFSESETKEETEHSRESDKANLSFKKAAVRTVSFWYNEANPKGVRVSHVITGLFIGRIPHKSPQYVIDFVNDVNPTRPLGLVVSVVEKDELKGKGFLGAKMVKPAEWNELEVDHHLISMVDFTAVVDTPDSIETIKKIRDCIVSGKSAYVHCKAGRSRSALFCIIYLCCYMINPLTGQRYTVEEALQLLKNARNNVDVGKSKKAKAEEIIEEIKEIPEIWGAKNKAHDKRIDVLLGSKTIKDGILKLPAVDALRDYKIASNKEHTVKKASKRGKRINQILKLIAKPHSEEWYFKLISTKGIYARFIEAGPRGEDEKDIRKGLIDNLRDEVIAYIADELNYTFDPEEQTESSVENSLSVASI